MCLRRCSRPPPTPTFAERCAAAGETEVFPLDGAWFAASALGSDGKPAALNPWLCRLRIRGADVVLGDDSSETIEERSGRLRLCGGEIVLHGDTLLRCQPRQRRGSRVWVGLGVFWGWAAESGA